MLTEKNQTRNHPLIIGFLIACGAVGPILFILVFLVESATRPGYSAWRNFVSSLSLSNQGWMQVANFLICGLLALGFAIGLRLVLRTGKGSIGGPLLLGIYGLGLIMAGLFTTDPNLGYPPGSPVNGHQTLHGTVHGIAGIIVFFVASTGASVLDATGALPNSPTGLLQRIAIIVGWGWVALLAIRLLGTRSIR